MKIPVFFITFIFLLIFYNIKLRRAGKEAENSKAELLRKEQEAMFVRKKSLDDLNYISVSFDDLPILEKQDILSDAEKRAYRHQQSALAFASRPMVNLDGISNTDLKLQYGPANLETLVSYEQNYQNLLKALLNWGKYLYEANRRTEAINILEKAIDVGSDLSQSYILLSDLYYETHQKNKLLKLKKLVENHQKQNIMLRKILQHIDHKLNS